MPKKGYLEKKWRCSWDCGYKSMSVCKAVKHENTHHDAIKFVDKYGGFNIPKLEWRVEEGKCEVEDDRPGRKT